MIIAIIGGLAALHAASRVIAPMLLSVLCAVLLAPPVNWLTRVGIPRLCASALVLGLLIVLIGLVFGATWQPARSWLDTAPTTMTVIEGKLRPLQNLFQELDHFGREAQRFSGATNQSQIAPTSSGLPMTVMTLVPGAAMTVVTSLAFVFLLLVTGPLCMERIKDSVSPDQRRRVTLVMETVRRELLRYSAAIAMISVVLGIATGLLVRAFGVPNALLWGAMAGLFSLVPYLGSIATLTLLTLVGLVTFDSLPPVIGLSGSFLLLEILEGQFIQPFLLGQRLELNPVVVVLSIWVFGALWGFAGVVLAVPLLLTLKASVAHIDALHALSPLIGSISVPPSMRNTRSAPLQHPTAWWRRVVFAHGARDTSELLN